MRPWSGGLAGLVVGGSELRCIASSAGSGIAAGAIGIDWHLSIGICNPPIPALIPWHLIAYGITASCNAHYKILKSNGKIGYYIAKQ